MVDAHTLADVVDIGNAETMHYWTPEDILFFGLGFMQYREDCFTVAAEGSNEIFKWADWIPESINLSMAQRLRSRCERTQLKHDKLWGGCPEVTLTWSSVGVYGERSDCRCRVACLAVRNYSSGCTSSQYQKISSARTAVQSG